MSDSDFEEEGDYAELAPALPDKVPCMVLNGDEENCLYRSYDCRWNPENNTCHSTSLNRNKNRVITRKPRTRSGGSTKRLRKHKKSRKTKKTKKTKRSVYKRRQTKRS